MASRRASSSVVGQEPGEGGPVVVGQLAADFGQAVFQVMDQDSQVAHGINSLKVTGTSQVPVTCVTHAP
jgi:hypothetical protein